MFVQVAVLAKCERLTSLSIPVLCDSSQSLLDLIVKDVTKRCRNLTSLRFGGIDLDGAFARLAPGACSCSLVLNCVSVLRSR
jgi:hypothetical protein